MHGRGNLRCVKIGLRRIPSMRHKIKVLIAKPGLDGHDRGAIVVAQSLRDAGMEVLYTGIRQTPEQIVETALQEDVDFIGLSCLSGAHVPLFQKVMKLLKKQKSRGQIVFAGGIIPDADISKLKKIGIKAVFTPGASTQEIIEYI